MIIDFNTSESGVDKVYDVCVCGSGPAGITLALKLAEKGKTVALLEGGGENYSQESQDIYSAKSIGLKAWVNLMRQRFFGGTSNHWLGRCRPFDKSDFEYAPPTGVPGWPIGIDELDPFVDEAMTILDLDKEKGFTPFHANSKDGNFTADIGLFSAPTRFKSKYGKIISESKNIELFVNANLVDIKLTDSENSVSEIEIKNFKGGSAKFKASKYVLAMGAVENARLLLNSDSQAQAGIGNHSDYVGRCFMEHPHLSLGEYVKKNNESLSDTHYDFEFYTSDQIVKNEGVNKANFTFQKIAEITSYGRTAKIKSFFKALSCDWGIEEKVQFISHFKCPGTGYIWTQSEQYPNKESRVFLGEEKDSLGLRKAVLDWRVTDKDLAAYRKSAVELAKSFSNSDLGKIKLEEYMLDESLEIPFVQHAHHMGTTRMAAKPEDGVVNQNCKVFGTDNLYIAGSSIFSTGGACNPTFAIVQFSLRLAEHLAQSEPELD